MYPKHVKYFQWFQIILTVKTQNYIYIYIYENKKKGILTSKSLNNCASAASCAHVENLTDSPHMLQSTGSHNVVDACHCPSESWPRGHTLQVVLFTGHCFLYFSLEDKDNLLNSFESLYDWRDQLGWCHALRHNM